MTSELNEEGLDIPSERPISARLGILALILLTPGLGLIRVGKLRDGLLMIAAPVALALVMCLCAAFSGPATFRGYVAVFGAMLVGMLTVYGASAVLTWKSSRFVTRPNWWSRWYMLGAIWIGSGLALHPVVNLIHHFYQTFYSPSESMTPTVVRRDRFLVDMRAGRAPKRGDIIVFDTADGRRLSRVAAVGGDTIEMRSGVPIVNGRPAGRTNLGVGHFPGFDGVQTALVIDEQLPGEAAAHTVLDDDARLFDTMSAVRIPTGTVFVLGDNRGRAADSRVPREEGGVGMVPVSAILGRPLFIYWSFDHRRIGTSIGRQDTFAAVSQGPGTR